jgi:hypothetical protein
LPWLLFALGLVLALLLQNALALVTVQGFGSVGSVKVPLFLTYFYLLGLSISTSAATRRSTTAFALFDQPGS